MNFAYLVKDEFIDIKGKTIIYPLCFDIDGVLNDTAAAPSIVLKKEYVERLGALSTFFNLICISYWRQYPEKIIEAFKDLSIKFHIAQIEEKGMIPHGIPVIDDQAAYYTSKHSLYICNGLSQEVARQICLDMAKKEIDEYNNK